MNCIIKNVKVAFFFSNMYNIQYNTSLAGGYRIVLEIVVVFVKQMSFKIAFLPLTL